MPETTVAAIITRQDEQGVKVLLTRRAVEPFKGQWCLPGGHIDKHEPVLDAVIREVREEVDLKFEPHFFRYFDEIILERDIHNVVLAFAGTATGTLHASADEVQESGWFSLDEAHGLSFAFIHGEILDAYASQSEAK